MKYKKIFIGVLMLLGSTMMVMSGCSSKSEAKNEEVLTYSNLVEEEGKQEIEEYLLERGVPAQSMKVFREWVNDYNEHVNAKENLEKGFHTISAAQADYKKIDFEPRENEEGIPYSEVNCRLTAFLLFKDFVNITNPVEGADNYLMFDVEAMEQHPLMAFDKGDESKFITLFNPVVVEDTTDKDKHIKSISEEWQNRGISFEQAEGISLLNLWMHDSYEQKRFIGHSGILVRLEEGFIFIEKYSASDPFQVSKFNEKQEVIDYLLSRGDINGDDSESDIIITENEKVVY